MLVYQAGYVFSEHVSEIFRKKFPASIETQVKRANIERERERERHIWENTGPRNLEKEKQKTTLGRTSGT